MGGLDEVRAKYSTCGAASTEKTRATALDDGNAVDVSPCPRHTHRRAVANLRHDLLRPGHQDIDALSLERMVPRMIRTSVTVEQLLYWVWTGRPMGNTPHRRYARSSFST
jgi:hypothetical protein